MLSLQLLRLQRVLQPDWLLRRERLRQHSSQAAALVRACPSVTSAIILQLLATGGLLAERGFKFWDLGMVMDYKVALGGSSLPRSQFRSRLELARKCAAAASLPPQLWEAASQSIARVMRPHHCVQQLVESCQSVAEVKEVVQELRARGAAAERIQEAMTCMKQMLAAAAGQQKVSANAASLQRDDAGLARSCYV